MSDATSCQWLRYLVGVLLALASAGCAGAPSEARPYFKIQVLDEQTHRGVPLVELRTVNQLCFCTDSNGVVAFQEPGLMGRPVWFGVRSHGYEFPKNGFGFAGVVLETRAGGSATINIRRINIAERLYRITGEGIYRDSVLTGEPAPIRQPLLNAQVAGQDSAIAAVYRDKIYWFWGDTSRPRHPLGHFRTAGATSGLPDRGGLDPAVGVDLNYFTDREGFSRPMCDVAGEGMVWIDGVAVVPDDDGRQRLVAHYARMKSLGEMLEHGLAIYDDRKERFEKARHFDLTDQWRCPRGHPLRVRDGSEEYLVYPAPFPCVRVRARLASVREPADYEAFTCLVAGSRWDGLSSSIERSADGRCVWGWKAGTDPVDSARERELIAGGKIRPADARFQLQDAETGESVQLHGGSFNWNEYRRKWILIGVQIFGASVLGEVWFAEADEPTGPWRWARKVLTHEQYSFYNPVHHAFFDQQGGRLIYFEGTYTTTFSGNPCPTPRYEYNQIMYRLDLADPRLRLPQAQEQRR